MDHSTAIARLTAPSNNPLRTPWKREEVREFVKLFNQLTSGEAEVYLGYLRNLTGTAAPEGGAK